MYEYKFQSRKSSLIHLEQILGNPILNENLLIEFCAKSTKISRIHQIYIYIVHLRVNPFNQRHGECVGRESIIFDEANMSIKETRSKRSIEMNSWSRHFFRRSCLSARAIRWRTLWFDPEDWIRGNSFALLFLPSDFASIKAKLKR